MARLAPGDVFAGKYVVQRELGEGGFATVYLADYRGMPVALKIIQQESGGYEPGVVARTRREAEVLQRLESPTTVRLIEAGISHDGQLFLAFEYVPGEDLADLLAERGRLEAHEVVHILTQVLSSLREAHHKGLIHRDIKPENIRVTADSVTQSVKPIDFGIARPTEEGASNITKTGEIVGTLRYMSPEQLMSMPTTEVSDIYSLGVVGIELLLGSEALHGSKLGDQFDRLQSDYRFMAPAGAGHDLWQVLAGMTARDPRERYPSCQAVLDVLVETEAPTTKLSTTTPVARSPQKNNLVGLAGLLVVGVLTAIAVWVGLQREDGEAPVVDEHPVVQPPMVKTPAAADDASDVREPIDAADPDAVRVGYRSAGCGLRRSSSLSRELGFSVLVPPDYDPERAYPLVVLLHDERVPPADLVRYGGLRDAAADHDVVVIAPEHVRPVQLVERDRYRKPWSERHHSRAVIHEARDAALAELCIDPSRIFVVGHGAGTFGVQAVGCEDWVAGLGFFGGALLDAPRLACPTARRAPRSGCTRCRRRCCRSKAEPPARDPRSCR